MLKTLVVYHKNDFILIQPNARTITGLFIADEPMIRLNSTVSPLDLGAAILQTVANTKSEVPQPTDWKLLEKNHLQILGMKSYKELHLNCKMCSASYNGEVFSFRPTENRKNEFINIPNEVLTVDSLDAEKIGNAVKLALEKSH